MKLYGTITSERASKGQGGNDFLNVKLLIGGKHHQIEIGILRLEPYEDSNVKGYLLALDRSSNLRKEAGRVYGEILTIETKAKRQKDEHKHYGEDCLMSDCTICDTTVWQCELDENLQCNNCK